MKYLSLRNRKPNVPIEQETSEENTDPSPINSTRKDHFYDEEEEHESRITASKVSNLKDQSPLRVRNQSFGNFISYAEPSRESAHQKGYSYENANQLQSRHAGLSPILKKSKSPPKQVPSDHQLMKDNSGNHRNQKFHSYASTMKKSGDDIEDHDQFNFDFDGQSCSYVNTTLQSESTPGRQSQRKEKPHDFDLKVNKIEAYSDHECEKRLNSSENNSSGYVIEYEQMLKDREQTSKYDLRPSQQNKGCHDYRKRDFYDIGDVPILEQTQANETSSESPQIKSDLKRMCDEAKESRQKKMGELASETQKLKNEINLHMQKTEDMQDHSLRNGIQIFAIPFGGDDSASQSTAKQRHQRISSVPKSILQNKMHAQTKSKDIMTARTEKISEKEISHQNKPSFQNEVSQHAREVLFSATEDFSHIKQTPSAVKSLKSNIEELAPQEKYINGEIIGSNLSVVCIIRKAAKKSLSQNKSKPSSQKASLSPELRRTGALSSRSNSSYQGFIRNKDNNQNIRNSHTGTHNQNNSFISPYIEDTKRNLSSDGSNYSKRKRWRERNSASLRLQDNKKISKKLGNLQNKNHCNLLATQEPSKYVFRCAPGLQTNLLKVLLKNEQEVANCSMAFDAISETTLNQSMKRDRKALKVFEFDNCIAETNGHSLSLGLKIHNDQFFKQRVEYSLGQSNLVFLFGQTEAKKTELLNVIDPNSMFNLFVQHRDIKFMRCSMFYLGQEYLLAHKQFGTKHQMKLELGNEIREAFRERDLNSKKIALKESTVTKKVKADDVKLASHLVLQLDNLIFVDLADIDNLKDPQLAKKISADFSMVTNSILSLSPFYKDHNFDQTSGTSNEAATYGDQNNFRTGSTNFGLLMKNYLTGDVKILLLCCVVENSVAGTQAVEYCHKIKCYFKGDTQEKDSQDLSRTGAVDANMSIFEDQANAESVKAFKQLAGLISEVEKTKVFINKMFEAKKSGKGPNRTHAQLKHLVERLRDDVGEMLSLLAEKNEIYANQFGKIKNFIQKEIIQMNEKVCCLRSLSRSMNSNKKNTPKIAAIPQSKLVSRKKTPDQSTNNFTPVNRSSGQVDIPTKKHSVTQIRPHSYTGTNIRHFSQNQNHEKEPIFLIKKKPNSLDKLGTSFCQTPKSRQSIMHNQSKVSEGYKPLRKKSDGKEKKHKINLSNMQMTHSNRNGTMSTRNNQRSAYLLPLSSSQTNLYQKTRLTQNNRISASSSKKVQKQQKPIDASQNYDLTHIVEQQQSRTSNFMRNETPAFVSMTEKPAKQKKTDSSLSEQAITLGQEANIHDSRLPPKAQTLGSSPRQSLPQSQHYTFRPTPQSQANHQNEIAEQLVQKVYELSQKLNEAHYREDETKLITSKMQEYINLKDKENQILKKKVIDLEEGMTIKDKIIASLESQLKSHQNEHPKREDRKYTELMEQKKRTDEINNDVISQIGMLKEAISSFQQQEKFNRQLLENQKKKDQEMKELRQQVNQLLKLQIQVSSHTNKHPDYFQEPQKLSAKNNNAGQKASIDSVERKRSRSKSNPKKDSRDQINSNSDTPHKIALGNQQSKMQELQNKVHQLEKAKEGFNDQTMELKQEIRKLRQHNIQMSSLGSEDRPSSVMTGDSHCSTLQHNRLSELKDLIKGYKREKKQGSRDNKFD